MKPKECYKANLSLIEIGKRQSKEMKEMHNMMMEKDEVIGTYYHKDITLRLMNKKVVEMNTFFGKVLDRMKRRFEKGTTEQILPLEKA